MKYVGKEDCIIVTCDKSIIGKNVIYCKNKRLDPVEIARIILKNNAIKR